MSDDPGGDLAMQDELLELLYWLEGEGFRANATRAGIARFLGWEERVVGRGLERLRARGYVTDVATDVGAEARLTEVGRREAARRFADEFAPLLGQGHGECSDPACECRTNPAGAAECHAAARSAGGREH